MDTRMYVTGLTNSGNKIAQYDLSTPWDILTATLAGTLSSALAGVRFQDNGDHMFVLDTQDPDTIKKYECTVPWDIIIFPFPYK